MKDTYNVNGNGFQFFSEAVAYAKERGLTVVQTDNGLTRWSPAPVKTAKRVKHVIVNADGSETEFSHVRH